VAVSDACSCAAVSPRLLSVLDSPAVDSPGIFRFVVAPRLEKLDVSIGYRSPIFSVDSSRFKTRSCIWSIARTSDEFSCMFSDPP